LFSCILTLVKVTFPFFEPTATISGVRESVDQEKHLIANNYKEMKKEEKRREEKRREEKRREEKRREERKQEINSSDQRELKREGYSRFAEI